MLCIVINLKDSIFNIQKWFFFLDVGNPQIISRQQWGARAAKSKIDDIVIKPAPYVIIHDSGGKACENQTACQSLVKDIQVNDSGKDKAFFLDCKFFNF